MEKPIGVGDLVQVVRKAPCGCEQGVGRIFKVAQIKVSKRGVCWYCRANHPVAECSVDEDGFFCDLYRLKRIPPLDELETVRTEDEVTA